MKGLFNRSPFSISSIEMTVLQIAHTLIQILKEDKQFYSLSTVGGTISSLSDQAWIPLTIGVLTIIKLSLDIYNKHIQPYVNKKKNNEDQSDPVL